jgi:hypothetical protein
LIDYKKIAEYIEGIHKSFDVSAIAETLESYSEINDNVVKNATQHHYDRIFHHSPDGIIDSYLDIKKSLENFNPIYPTHIISSNTRIGHAMPIICKNGFTLLLEENKLTGIVTISDLEKPPVKMWVYGQLNILEILFKTIIRQFYPNDSCIDLLSDNRKTMILTVFNEKSELNEDIDIVECLYFSDISSILQKSKNIRKLIFKDDVKTGIKNLKSISKPKGIRNIIAHSDSIHKYMEWSRFSELMAFIEQTSYSCQNLLELIQAYSDTNYILENGIRFNVDSENKQLSEFMLKNEITQAAFITAYNPLSVESNPKLNQEKHEKLGASLSKKYKVTQGAGSDAQEIWPPEPSYFVHNIDYSKAVQLAQEFNQLAFVFVNQDVKLVMIP